MNYRIVTDFLNQFKNFLSGGKLKFSENEKTEIKKLLNDLISLT